MTGTRLRSFSTTTSYLNSSIVLKFLKYFKYSGIKQQKSYNIQHVPENFPFDVTIRKKRTGKFPGRNRWENAMILEAGWKKT